MINKYGHSSSRVWGMDLQLPRSENGSKRSDLMVLLVQRINSNDILRTFSDQTLCACSRHDLAAPSEGLKVSDPSRYTLCVDTGQSMLSVEAQSFRVSEPQPRACAEEQIGEQVPHVAEAARLVQSRLLIRAWQQWDAATAKRTVVVVHVDHRLLAELSPNEIGGMRRGFHAAVATTCRIGAAFSSSVC